MDFNLLLHISWANIFIKYFKANFLDPFCIRPLNIYLLSFNIFLSPFIFELTDW